MHRAVMVGEVLENLRPRAGNLIVDCTLGDGGHTKVICQQIRPGGRLIGIDQDEEALERASHNLKEYKKLCTLVHGNFRDLDNILDNLKITGADGIIFDLGLSSFQIEMPERGFSFRYPGPLDMRMDRSSQLLAYELINYLSQGEIFKILRTYGEERWANRIARHIVRARKKAPVTTTTQLADIIRKALPPSNYYRKIHPATRTFQAFRIVVNQEIESLNKGLVKAIARLNPGGRICVISFHSLEDRVVKEQFRNYSREGILRLVVKKPLVPSRAEILTNRRSRSAKLRVAEKI